MKIQLDYDNKTITLEDDIIVGEFLEKIETLLPNWKEWKMATRKELNFEPVFIQERYYTGSPVFPWPVTVSNCEKQGYITTSPCGITQIEC